jgi:glycosyltransferase involved in cell wall biosynthesis
MSAGTPASVLFICDFPPGFVGAKYHEAGVGGTEALVVVLAEELARRGAAVTVATQIEHERIERVRYQPIETVRPADAEVTVVVKQWSDVATTAGGLRVFLATDVHVSDRSMVARCIAWSSTSLALSPFMRSRLQAETVAPTMEVLSPPIELTDYADASHRRDPVLLYCSVPDRGLYYLKDIFPAIRKRVKNARLVITSDFTLWGRAAAKNAFQRFFDRVAGVEYLGHVDRRRLVIEQRRARVLVYPCTFPEGFCIAAAECMAAGVVPLTTDAFALTTTVGEAGVLIKGRPRSWWYRRRFVNAAVKLLTDDAEWSRCSEACRARAQTYGAAAVADRFLALIAGERGRR